jgi:hypothetical protein
VLKADNLPPSCAIVTKSGDLNFLEPSGLAQACNGTALHLQLSFIRLVQLLVISDSRYILWMKVQSIKWYHRGYS